MFINANNIIVPFIIFYNFDTNTLLSFGNISFISYGKNHSAKSTISYFVKGCLKNNAQMLIITDEQLIVIFTNHVTEKTKSSKSFKKLQIIDKYGGFGSSNYRCHGSIGFVSI